MHWFSALTELPLHRDAYVENVVGDVLQALNVIMKEGEYLGEWTRNLRFSDYSEVKNELTLTKEDGTTQS